MMVTENGPHDAATPTHDAFSLLESGIPLSLLLDLAVHTDVHEIYRSEDAATDWIQRRSA